MSTKKYRLLKDLPECKAGNIFIEYSSATGKAYYCIVEDKKWETGYSAKLVENTPDWFQEVSEGVEVTSIGYVQDVPKGGGQYYFCTSKQIHPDQFPVIKLAISKCLNEVSDCELEKPQVGIYIRKKGDVTAYMIKEVTNVPNCQRVRLTNGYVCNFEEYYSKIKSGEFKIEGFSKSETTITLEQLNEERRKAFNAGRAMYKIQIPNNGKQYGDFEFHHPTFEDYLKTLSH